MLNCTSIPNRGDESPQMAEDRSITFKAMDLLTGNGDVFHRTQSAHLYLHWFHLFGPELAMLYTMCKKTSVDTTKEYCIRTPASDGPISRTADLEHTDRCNPLRSSIVHLRKLTTTFEARLHQTPPLRPQSSPRQLNCLLSASNAPFILHSSAAQSLRVGSLAHCLDHTSNPISACVRMSPCLPNASWLPSRS